MSTTLTPAQLKEKFRREGKTLSAWAKEHGYKPQFVYRVVSGNIQARYGRSHRVAVELGLKSETAG